MSYFRKSLIGICVATASLGVWAQSADEHKEHHPEGVTSPAAVVQKLSSDPMLADKTRAMDQHIKAMQSMHEKMVSAKSQEERQALMVEHMKLMQNGMAMMKGMGSQAGMGGIPTGKAKNASMAECQQMMGKRMDMMESMMKMMMDHMPAAPTK